MSHGSELKSRGAMALRAAGYKPCPRWWLTAEQLELVEYMAHQNAKEVNAIRASAYEPGAEPVDHSDDVPWDASTLRMGQAMWISVQGVNFGITHVDRSGDPFLAGVVKDGVIQNTGLFPTLGQAKAYLRPFIQEAKTPKPLRPLG